MTDLSTTPTEAALVFGITDGAAKRIAQIAESEGTPGLMLRVTVSGGGCSGFQYGFKLEDHIESDDRLFEHQGVKVVIDDISLGFVEGAVVDFKEDLGGSYFQISNPNAVSSCGCGSSFAI